MPDSLSYLILLGLLALNALYVAAEFASVSLPKSRLKPLAERGNNSAQRLLHHLDEPARLDRYIAACQVGITWSSLVIGAYGQFAFAPSLSRAAVSLFGWQPAVSLTAATVAILILLTTIQMIFGELVPKSLALHDPLRVALWTAPPMRWSLSLYSAFITFLNGSGNALLRLLGRKADGHGHVHSPEEIALLLSGSGKAGHLEPLEEERLRGALKLATRPVTHLMTPRTAMRKVLLDEHPEAVFAKVIGAPYSRIPVFDGDAVAGIAHAKDAMRYFLEHGRPPSVKDILKDALFVPEAMTADKLYRFLQEQATHMVLVVDEFGGVIGLVTLDDLVAEMLGDMPDEFKRGVSAPLKLADGRFRVPGGTRLDDLLPLIGDAWEGEAATVGGMILETLGHLPVQGEKIRTESAEIEAEKVEGNLIATVLVRILDGEARGHG